MQTKFLLDENQMPKHYYNIIPDLPRKLAPILNPKTRKPVKPEELSLLFPKELIRQETSAESRIRIPEEVREAYRIYRPTPLIRACRLEKALRTPAKIFFKYEGASPTGSHKTNTALAQAYYNAKEGVATLTTETGAGQWGSALSFACNAFKLKCKVFMVRVSYEQKPYRRIMMETFGAEVIPSPSKITECGRRVLEKDPESLGSLGIAISEAVESAVKDENTHYSLGSVLNHVLLHQTVIGLEAKEQLKYAEAEPDLIIGCVGGGSNFSGLAFPFVKQKLKGEEISFLSVEPKACPTLTGGNYRYDYGDAAGITPLMKMYTLGHEFVPPGIHAGGLRYHGDSPILSLLHKEGLFKARAYEQGEVFKAAVMFAKAEGIIPAPETSHAVKAAIDEAVRCKRKGAEKTIMFNFSGHGYFDLSAYDSYLRKEL